MSEKQRMDWWLPEAEIMYGGNGWKWLKGTNFHLKISCGNVQHDDYKCNRQIICYWSILHRSIQNKRDKWKYNFFETFW